MFSCVRFHRAFGVFSPTRIPSRALTHNNLASSVRVARTGNMYRCPFFPEVELAYRIAGERDNRIR
jgi:hypothetical protein